MRYMIHACRQREWYVKEYLIPSMTAQGIKRKDITVWMDKNGDGNLVTTMNSFREIGRRYEPNEGIWHLQDDVVISKRFREATEENDDGIVHGFSNKEFDGKNVNAIGRVSQWFSWFSFPCIRIPNDLAAACEEWYRNEVKFNDMYPELTAENRHDDLLWKHFIENKHTDMYVTNLMPNIVDHIDYLIGGSLVNKQRDGIRTAYWWSEQETVEKLKKELAVKNSRKNKKGGTDVLSPQRQGRIDEPGQRDRTGM